MIIDPANIVLGDITQKISAIRKYISNHGHFTGIILEWNAELISFVPFDAPQYNNS